MRRGNGGNSGRADPESPAGNREKILATALRLFAAQGVGGTPTARISREAGVSTGTLFHYFPEKNRLVLELHLAIKHEIGEALRAEDDPALPVRERFDRCLRAYVAWGLAHPEKVRFLDQFDYLPDVGDELKEHEAYEDLAWMLELVRMAVREGVLPDLPPAFLGPMIVRVLNGILAVIAAGETGMAEDEVVEAGLAMLRRA
jgi:AcrR family transcriptional regulator